MHRSGSQSSPWLLALAIQDGRQGEEQRLLKSCSFACLQCPFLPGSAGIELKAAQFLCVAADSPRFQNSSCEKAVFNLLLCVGNAEQQERVSVCMLVPGCISLSLHFEGCFLSHKHWRLFILYLKLPRSWWYLLNRIYFWFLFICSEEIKHMLLFNCNCLHAWVQECSWVFFLSGRGKALTTLGRMNRAKVSTSLNMWPGESKVEIQKVIIQKFFCNYVSIFLSTINYSFTFSCLICGVLEIEAGSFCAMKVLEGYSEW